MTLVVETKNGKITVPDAVLAGIAVRAAESMDGIRVRRRRAVGVGDQVVRLTVSARRGDPLAEVGERTQARVAEALKSMCDLDVKVDVTIGELE